MNYEIKNILEGKYDYHIMPLFWQKGEDEETLREYMRKIYDCDIREVILESRPFPEFCRDKWWDHLKMIIDIAKELGMKVWIFDDSHFPTGYANGVVSKTPEKRKIVIKANHCDMFGPLKSAAITVDAKLLGSNTKDTLLAVIADNGNERVDITKNVKNKTLYWDVPKGAWKVSMIYTTKDTDIFPDYINMVDKESCDILIEEVYEAHYKYFKDDFGKTIVGFFTDEPCFNNEKGNKFDSLIGKEMPLPWSNAVVDALKDRLGNEYLKYLPSLWLLSSDSPRVRHIYMDIVSTLYQQCFDENIGTWCRQHHVQHIGHVIEDRDAHARLGMGAGHFFKSMAGQDMAGIDIVLNQLVPGIDEGNHYYGRGYWDAEFFSYLLVKLGTSLSHIDPLKNNNTMAEVFGAFGWHEGMKQMKYIIDHFIVRGNNYFVPHAFSQAEFPDADCPPHFYAHGNNPQYRYFHLLMEYTNKLSTIISNGQSKPQAAILYHADAEWTGKFMLNQKVARELTRNQIDFDIVPSLVFQQKERYQYNDSKGLMINNYDYPCLIVPYCEYIGKEVVAFIKKAKDMNYPIYFIDELPSGMYDSNQPLPDLSHVKIVPLNEIAKQLKNDDIFEIETSEYQRYLRYYHYVKADGDYIIFVNEDPASALSTHIKSTMPMRYKYDVITGKIYRFDGNLYLSPGELCVIINGEIPVEIVSNEHQYKNEIELDEKYQVEYISSKEYPKEERSIKIEKLINLDISEIKEATGTYRYTKEIIMKKELEHAIIDLGDVFEIAELFINGKSQGVRFGYPYSFEINNLKKGINMIQIEVTNKLDKSVKEVLSYSEVIEPTGLLGPVKIKY